MFTFTIVIKVLALLSVIATGSRAYKYNDAWVAYLKASNADRPAHVESMDRIEKDADPELFKGLTCSWFVFLVLVIIIL